jgi:hypothetical protein
MDVFRHDYVADESKSESRAHLVQNCDKAISRPRRAKQWSPAIAAKGDEVKVPASVVASQRIAHEKNRTLETDLSQGSVQEGAAPNLQTRPGRNATLRLESNASHVYALSVHRVLHEQKPHP